MTCSKDLRIAFPDIKGFSRTDLFYMRMFAMRYPNTEFVQALPEQLQKILPTIGEIEAELAVLTKK